MVEIWIKDRGVMRWSMPVLYEMSSKNCYLFEISCYFDMHINFTFLVKQCKPQKKLPVLYLIDSIMKNLGSSSYKSLFSKNIVQMFTSVFEQVRKRFQNSGKMVEIVKISIFVDTKFCQLFPYFITLIIYYFC